MKSHKLLSHKIHFSLVTLCLIIAAWLVASRFTSEARHLPHLDRVIQPSTNKRGEIKGADAYGKLPLSFEANRGQADSDVKFLARGRGYGLFLRSDSALLTLSKTEHSKLSQQGEHEDERSRVVRSAAVLMRLEGALPVNQVEGLKELGGKVNYFIGNDPSKWRTSIPTFEKVRYQDVYRGIDVIYYGHQGELEYDFVVAPDVDPGLIRLAFAGQRKINLDHNGDLVLQTRAGDVRQRRPFAYQEIDGQRREVRVRYRTKGNKVSFILGEYDRRLPLVIDPAIVYSSFLGGAFNEAGAGIAVDSNGSAYLTGNTASPNFPVVNALQPASGSFNDAFVVKLNPAGTAMVYSTYLGGNGDDFGSAIAVDAAGNAYVVGRTGSGSFPTTPGAFQMSSAGSIDGFVTKLNPSGSALVYSTFLGGNNSDFLTGIAVDSAGRAYVAGRTESTAIAIPIQRGGNPYYRSTDAAAHWTANTPELTPSIVNAFAIQNNNSNVIYAGTNYGVFKSITGGDHWNRTGFTRLSTAPNNTNVVLIDPSDPSIVYAAGLNNIYKSTDGGGLYDIKNGGFLSPPLVLSMAIDPGSPGTLYAGTSQSIFKSTNGAESWTEIRNGLPGTMSVNEIVLDPSNSSILYMGTSRGMYKSTNGGSLWSGINIGFLSSSTPITAVAIDPINPLTLYAGTNGFGGPMYKTTNGGSSWLLSADGLTTSFGGHDAVVPINALAVDKVTPTTIYAASTSAAIFKTTDGGSHWNQSNNGLANLTATAVVIDPNNQALLHVGTNIVGDAFVVRLSAEGGIPEYQTSLSGNEFDEIRAIAVDSDGSAYVTGSTRSANFPTVNAFQSTLNGFVNAFVTKLGTTGNVVYSTYLGGTVNDAGRGIAVRNGNAYVTGQTNSAEFPRVNAFKTTLPEFETDAFVTKLSTSGSSLDYSSFLGGSLFDGGLAIAVDGTGAAYVTGETASQDFPLKAPAQSQLGGLNDAFVTKINPGGTAIVSSTYLGGMNIDQGTGIAVDSSGNTYVIGTTSSANFPTVAPFQSNLAATDAFVTKLRPTVDLDVSMTDSPDPVTFGNNLTYTITVRNNGEVSGTGVTLVDNLPAGSTLVSAISTKGTCSGAGPVNCAIGTLNSDEVATVTVIIKPPALRTIDNVVTVSGNEPEGNTVNNSATVTTTVDFADLAITKSAVQARTAPGATLNYFVSVTNQLGTVAQNVTVTDDLPSTLAFVSCSANGGLCSASGNSVTATFSTLAVGKTQVMVIKATVSAAVLPGALIANTASVSAEPADPQPLDNTSTHVVSVGTTTTVSRVNGRIAFASDRNITGVTDPSGIYLVSPDGTNEHLFPNTTRDATNPVWSPDGSRIAFKPNYISPGEIDIINADGTGRSKIADVGLGPTFFRRAITWSPSGTQIAFVGVLGGFGSTSILIVGADGKGLVQLPGSPTGVEDLAWSPDGTKFLFLKNSNIFVIDIDGSNLHQLTTTEQTPDGSTSDFSPRWSPAGNKVLFMRNTNNLRKLFLMNPDGSGLTQVLNTGSQEGSWSPDGTKIVYAVGNELYQSNLDGSNTQRLTNNISYDFMPDWQPVPVNSVQFSNPTQSVGEGDGRALITVTRNGDTNAPATFDFLTADGTALQRTDYTLAAGTVRFAAGETSKTVTVLITDDAYVENAETFTMTLSNVEGAQIGAASVATISITDNDTVPGTSNPADDANFFVRQHYYDFLSRTPDQGGFDYWTSQITQCGSDQACLRARRIDVSNAFFYELEYQQTGAYVYRLYRAAFGNNQPFPNPFPNPQFPNEEKKLPSYQVFVRDRVRVRGGSNLAQLQLDLANSFVRRAEFISRYPANVDRQAFVDAILLTIKNDIGVDMTSSVPRQTLITAFDHGGRGEVLYRLADDNLQTNPLNNRAFIDAEYNRAFVVTQYFGYLRRNPDIAGFVFWLGQVNGAPLRDVGKQHAMVCSFITSSEYQQRFSATVTHNNTECGQ